MHITVEYAAQIKRAAGLSVETFECHSPCTVRDILDRVAQRHGESLSLLLFDEDRKLHPSILLFLGDSQVRPDEPRELQDHDTLTILSPISGG
jgi:molybdopterin converting factor small subunit